MDALAEYVAACGYPDQALRDGSALDVRWEASTTDIEGSEVTVLQAAWDAVGPISGPRTHGVVVVQAVRGGLADGEGWAEETLYAVPGLHAPDTIAALALLAARGAFPRARTWREL